MLHDREELHVREPRRLRVFGQMRGHFPVREGPVPLLGNPPPRTYMPLVDGNGCIEGVVFVSLVEPRPVAPFVAGLPYDRGRLGRRLCASCVWVRLLDFIVIEFRRNGVFINLSFPEPRNERFPYAGFVPSGRHTVRELIPPVEVPDYGYTVRVRSPDCEVDSARPVLLRYMGAQLFVHFRMGALLEKVNVVIRYRSRFVFSCFCLIHVSLGAPVDWYFGFLLYTVSG